MFDQELEASDVEGTAEHEVDVIPGEAEAGNDDHAETEDPEAWEVSAMASGYEGLKTMAEVFEENGAAHETGEARELASNGKEYYEEWREDEPTPTTEQAPIASTTVLTEPPGSVESLDDEDEAPIADLGAIVAVLVDLGRQARAHVGPEFNRQVSRELDGLDSWEQLYIGGFLRLAAKAALPGFRRG